MQPSTTWKKDGTLVAYMRDNGPPPKRVLTSQSKDNGETWSVAVDSDIPNPGSSLCTINLESGEWIMAYNDTEEGRHSLAIALSDDEGANWKWKRHIDRTEFNQGRFDYPNLIQAKDGSIDISYTYWNYQNPNSRGGSIKHAKFNKDWIKEGDSR